MIDILPYHESVCSFLKKQKNIWDYFSSLKYEEEQMAIYKQELLKNTYKFDVENDANIYDKIELCKSKLGLALNVHVYQSMYDKEMNASISYFGDEAHILLSGKLIGTLSDDELTAVLAHELSHVLLFKEKNGDFEIAERIITQLANGNSEFNEYYETARLYKLYTEIYCDRGSFIVLNTIDPAISSLVRAATELDNVNVAGYLKQADEIFKNEATFNSKEYSHPEYFIRARALSLWSAKSTNAEEIIDKMIIGNSALETMDVFAQEQLYGITKNILNWILTPNWMRTERTLSLAAHYFDNFKPDPNVETQELKRKIRHLHPSKQHYVSQVLFDFTMADKELETIPLGYALSIAKELELEKHLSDIIKKEHKLTVKKTDTMKETALKDYHKYISAN